MKVRPVVSLPCSNSMRLEGQQATKGTNSVIIMACQLSYRCGVPYYLCPFLHPSNNATIQRDSHCICRQNMDARALVQIIDGKGSCAHKSF
jgi:hypothetical protein